MQKIGIMYRNVQYVELIHFEYFGTKRPIVPI